MRFLATGDIQAHNWRQFSTIRPDGMNSRLYNCLQVFRIIRHEAKKRGIKRVLLNGDLIEENAYIETEVYDAVFKQIFRMVRQGLDVVLNVGNHDILRQSGGRVLHSLRPFGSIATVVEEPTLVWDSLQVVPWMEDPKEFKRVLRRLEGSRSRGLVLHCGVQGARTGPNAYLTRNPIHLLDVRPRDFAVVLLSDYHTSQRLAENVFYMGSPLQHTFGETHEPCIWDIELTDRDPHYLARPIPTELPLFIKLAIGPGDGEEALERISDTLCGNYVRIEIHPDAKVSDRFIEDFAGGRFLVQIVRKGSDVLPEEARPDALSPDEAITRYVKGKVKHRRRRLIELGLDLYKGEI